MQSTDLHLSNIWSTDYISTVRCQKLGWEKPYIDTVGLQLIYCLHILIDLHSVNSLVAGHSLSV